MDDGDGMFKKFIKFVLSAIDKFKTGAMLLSNNQQLKEEHNRMSPEQITDRRDQISKYLEQNPDATATEISQMLNIPNTSVRRHMVALIGNTNSGRLAAKKSAPATDLTIKKLEGEVKQWKKKYNESLSVLNEKDKQLEVLAALGDVTSEDPIKTASQRIREVVPVIVASDWHIEETVSAAITNGKNEYNPEIAERSVRQFFDNAAVLVNQTKQNSKVNTVVLAFLGDIINGVLRNEDLQNNAETPIDATVTARALIYKGIKHLVKATGCNLKVICCVGNHGRITEKVFPSNQVHQSLEYLIYKTIQRDFRDDPKVCIEVPETWYYIQDIFGVLVRFHHGHVFKFNGGIGGIAVPVQRKISQLNLIERADLDVCGHFHSMQTFNNCILNGSLVGANGYSMSLGIPFEPPRQTFFLIDSKYGRSVVTPIFIDRNVKKDPISKI